MIWSPRWLASGAPSCGVTRLKIFQGAEFLSLYSSHLPISGKQEESGAQKKKEENKACQVNVHGPTVFSNASDKPANVFGLKNVQKIVYWAGRSSN